MKTIKVFIDTNIVNKILDINKKKSKDLTYEEDRLYLSKIEKEFADKNIVQLIVNPSVKQEIENTSCPKRKRELLALFNQFSFTDDNKAIFPASFPFKFVTEEEKLILRELRNQIKDFDKDAKIFLDAVSNSEVEVLLTTDREHLVCIKLRDYLADKRLDTEIKIFTPKEFYEYLQKVQD